MITFEMDTFTGILLGGHNPDETASVKWEIMSHKTGECDAAMPRRQILSFSGQTIGGAEKS